MSHTIARLAPNLAQLIQHYLPTQKDTFLHNARFGPKEINIVSESVPGSGCGKCCVRHVLAISTIFSLTNPGPFPAQDWVFFYV